MICGEYAPSFDLSFGSLWLTPVSLLQFDMRFSAFQPSEAIFLLDMLVSVSPLAARR